MVLRAQAARNPAAPMASQNPEPVQAVAAIDRRMGNVLRIGRRFFYRRCIGRGAAIALERTERSKGMPTMRATLTAALALFAAGCADFTLAPQAAQSELLVDGDGDGYTPAGGDCDDTKASVHPGAKEICGDGIDQDCDGKDADCSATDQDGDGYPVKDAAGNLLDCDDSNFLVHPHAVEICGDGIDQDCDGKDLDCADVDADHDGYTPRKGDCNDQDPLTHPGAVEVCGDGIDQDCSGADQSCDTLDQDQDGFTPAGGDCNDHSPLINPRAKEICGNGIDEDCDGKDLPCALADEDGDGYAVEAGGPLPGGDCDDHNRFVYPGAREICGDGIDQDCNGSDLRCDWADQDGDGYAVAAGGPLPGGDCDDHNSRVHPYAVEICENGVDEDCAPEPAGWASAASPGDRLCPNHADQDGDGYAPEGGVGFPFPGGDCDDRAPAVYPGATEACDFIDNDCNGTIDDISQGCDHFDHRNANYTPAVGDGWVQGGSIYYSRLELKGVHLRIGTFTVPAGVEVGPVPVDASGNGGSLEIRAQSVVVLGSLTADGAGWGGGGGGAGAGNPGSWGCTSSSPWGNPGLGKRGGASGSSFNGSTSTGGTGGGALGGATGNQGGYGIVASGDLSAGQEIFLGSGGGGNGTNRSQSCPNWITAYYGGGSGGAGGGRLVLRASGSISVGATGTITADGLAGGTSSDANGAPSDSAPCTGQCSSNGSGAPGGGGGILMVCQQSGCLQLNGAVTAQPNGTVKLFCPGCSTASPSTVTAGRRCRAEIGGACANY